MELLADMMGGKEHVTDEMAEKFIKQCDNDQNGTIEKEELKQMLKEKMQKMYKQMADKGEKEVMAGKNH